MLEEAIKIFYNSPLSLQFQNSLLHNRVHHVYQNVLVMKDNFEQQSWDSSSINRPTNEYFLMLEVLQLECAYDPSVVDKERVRLYFVINLGSDLGGDNLRKNIFTIISISCRTDKLFGNNNYCYTYAMPYDSVLSCGARQMLRGLNRSINMQQDTELYRAQWTKFREKMVELYRGECTTCDIDKAVTLMNEQNTETDLFADVIKQRHM